MKTFVESLGVSVETGIKLENKGLGNMNALRTKSIHSLWKDEGFSYVEAVEIWGATAGLLLSKKSEYMKDVPRYID